MMLRSTCVCSAHAVVTGWCQEQLQAPVVQQQTTGPAIMASVRGESMRKQTSRYRLGVGNGDSSEPTRSRERQSGPGAGAE